MIAKLQAITSNILNKPDNNYNSHIWRRSAATNFSDAGVSLINLKRHGQWVFDSVVEGYIANSQPLCQEQLCCLLLEVEREKLERREKVGQQLNDFIENNNLLKDDKDESSMVDLSNLPGELIGTQQTDLTLYGFSQYYKPDVDIDIPLLTGCKKQKTAEGTEVTKVQHEKESTSEKSLMEKILSTATTYNNCTFVLWNSDCDCQVRQDKQLWKKALTYYAMTSMNEVASMNEVYIDTDCFQNEKQWSKRKGETK